MERHSPRLVPSHVSAFTTHSTSKQFPGIASTASGIGLWLSNHAALDHFQSPPLSTSPFLTGLAWMSSIIAMSDCDDVMLLSYPPPDCQNRRSVTRPRCRVIFGSQSGAFSRRCWIAFVATGPLIARRSGFLAISTRRQCRNGVERRRATPGPSVERLFFGNS
jgi:hypothetical protein